jgi:hypothetical protein
MEMHEAWHRNTRRIILMTTHLFSVRRTFVGVVAAVALVTAACHKSDSVTAPRAAASLQVSGGDQQIGIVGQPLQSPIIVQAYDGSGQPLAGVTVNFAVTTGGGSLSSATAVTDMNGRAEVQWTLGTLAGNGVVTATVNSSLTTTFSSVANAGSVVSLVKISGDGQSVAEGATTAPFLLRAVDLYGNAVAGVSITWVDANGGSLSADASVTDANGNAQITLQTDPQAESYVIAADASGVIPVDFTATSTVPSTSSDSSGTAGN